MRFFLCVSAPYHSVHRVSVWIENKNLSSTFFKLGVQQKKNRFSKIITFVRGTKQLVQMFSHSCDSAEMSIVGDFTQTNNLANFIVLVGE